MAGDESNLEEASAALEAGSNGPGASEQSQQDLINFLTNYAEQIEKELGAPDPEIRLVDCVTDLA